jgi:DUF971 family protein
MRPKALESIGQELAVKWEDETESFIRLEDFRRQCPCAACKGEVDIMGNLYKNPSKPLPAHAFTLIRLINVGTYAVQPVWGDGHSSGIYSFEYLAKICGKL